MASDIEKSICLLIRPILNTVEPGNGIADSESLRKVLSHLEIYLTLKLRDKYKDWIYESIDGIYTYNIKKVDREQFQFIGMCVLTTDQSVIPIYVDAKLSEFEEEFEMLDCKIGEHGKNGLMKIPFDSNQWRKKIYAMDADFIKWYYTINL